MKDTIVKNIEQNIQTTKKLIEISESIETATKIIMESLNNGGKLMIFGSGGSAADAQHMAAELINKFKIERKPIAAIALTTDTSIITSISNDSGYQYTFEKQVQALGKKGDIAFAITTSDYYPDGHSRVLEYALRTAKEKGMVTIGLIGTKGKNILGLLDYNITVPSGITSRTQEMHILVIHILCELIESIISEKKGKVEK